MPTQNNQTPLDPRSETNLKTLVESAQLQMRAFVNAANTPPFLPADWCFKITSGTRTYAEQDALFAQGGVTKARGGYSNHNFAIAIDVTLFNAHNEPVWESPLYAKAGALGEKMGLQWGGHWVTFKDDPHFQCQTGKSVSQLRALVAEHGTLGKTKPFIDALVKANTLTPSTQDAPPAAPSWKIAVRGVGFLNYFVDTRPGTGGAVMVPARAFLRALLGDADPRVAKLGFNDDTDFLTLGGHDLDGKTGGPEVKGVLKPTGAFCEIRPLSTAFGGVVKVVGKTITVTLTGSTG